MLDATHISSRAPPGKSRLDEVMAAAALTSLSTSPLLLGAPAAACSPGETETLGLGREGKTTVYPDLVVAHPLGQAEPLCLEQHLLNRPLEA